MTFGPHACNVYPSCKPFIFIWKKILLCFINILIIRAETKWIKKILPPPFPHWANIWNFPMGPFCPSVVGQSVIWSWLVCHDFKKGRKVSLPMLLSLWQHYPFFPLPPCSTPINWILEQTTPSFSSLHAPHVMHTIIQTLEIWYGKSDSF